MTRPMTFRASWHDYSSRCIYMVTLSKRPEVEPFGQLAGEVTDPSSVRIVCSPTGRAVRDQVHGLSLIEPAIRVLQYAVMPDHLHILLFVTRPMTEPLEREVAFGNSVLLRNPFKSQVVVHRRDDEAARALRRQEWLHVAANGGVLVSPFISPAEKAIRAEAEALGGRFIFLTDIPFTDRYNMGHKTKRAKCVTVVWRESLLVSVS